MVSVGPIDRSVIFWRGKNFNVAIFSDTINVINVKLYMMILLSVLYLFIPLSVTLTIPQNHGKVEQFQTKN